MTTATAEQSDWVKAVFGVDPSSYDDRPPGAAPGDGSTQKGSAPPPLPTKPSDAVPVGPDRVAQMDAVWQAALAKGNWPIAAKVVNGFAPADLKQRVDKLNEGDQAKLHQGALDCGIGPNSAVALATLDVAYRMALKAGDWQNAAKFLNAYNAGDMKARLSTLSADEVAKLHKGACDNRVVGPSSAVALASEVLAHPILGSMQSARADAILKTLSPDDQKKYAKVLDDAKSPQEKQFITKGLAAKHSVAELEAFAKKIAGKDARWLQDNLSLTGASDGSGVKQQWHDSCGPTTYEAVLGELDPLYALDKHEKNPNLNQVDECKATEKNPDLAADQRTILTDGGGIAVDRKGSKTKGRGRWIADGLNKVSASTGLTYDLKKIGDGATLDEGITALNSAAAAGEPVPISIGNGKANYQHYVLVTASDPGPPRYYTIHDPWDGKTVIRSEDQMRRGAIDIAGCNDFESFDKPTPVQVK